MRGWRWSEGSGGGVRGVEVESGGWRWSEEDGGGGEMKRDGDAVKSDEMKWT